MRKFKADIGDQYDAWTVVDRGQWISASSQKTYYYVCQHSCGALRKYRSIELDKPKRPCKSCEAGRYRMVEDKLAIARQEYRKYKGSAKARGYAFDITFDTYLKLVHMCCTYCTREPYDIKRMGYVSGDGKERTAIFGGIDRADNLIGYTEENCVPSCWICNRSKSVMSIDEWSKMVSLWSDALKYTAKADH